MGDAQSTVTIEGNPVGNMNSYIKQSIGNAVPCENLYYASPMRHSPAGNTVHARVYFYVDGHAPAVPPTPAPQ
jgi:hypothetical protein